MVTLSVGVKGRGGGGRGVGERAKCIHCIGCAYPEVNSGIYWVRCFGRKVVCPSITQPMS